jgi:hypothetical protein
MNYKEYQNKNGQLIRKWSDGSQEWRLNGALHRLDGPAYKDADGTELYCLHGRPHRLKGPAIIWYDGLKQWKLYGKDMPQKLHYALTKGPKRNLLLLMGQGYDEIIEARLKGLL